MQLITAIILYHATHGIRRPLYMLYSTCYKYMGDIQHLPHTTYWTRHDRFQLKIIFLVQAFLTQSGDLSAVKGFELKGSSSTCILYSVHLKNLDGLYSLYGQLETSLTRAAYRVPLAYHINCISNELETIWPSHFANGHEVRGGTFAPGSAQSWSFYT